MVLKQAGAERFPVVKPSEINHVFFFTKTQIYQNKTIFMTSFLHYNVTVGKNFYTLTFDKITTIFNPIFKTCYRILILETRNA